MKCALILLLVAVPLFSAIARTSEPPLSSAVFEWTDMAAETIPKGVRRHVFDGSTTSGSNIHCHITTLNAGEASGEPALHLNEEVIIIKEGRVEVSCDGKLSEAGPGSVVYFAANSVTRLRNIGDGAATYYVLYHYQPEKPGG